MPDAQNQQKSLDEIRQRVDAAEQDGWYGYDEEARADVRWLVEQLEARGEVIAEARDALWWIVDRRTDAGGTLEMLLRAYRLLDKAIACSECGMTGEHGLGCPKGPHPMAGKTAGASSPAKKQKDLLEDEGIHDAFDANQWD